MARELGMARFRVIFFLFAGSSPAVSWILTLSLLWAFLFPSIPVFGETLDRIVAVVESQVISDKPVDPQIITQSEVDELIQPTLAKLRLTGENVSIDSIRRRGLDELILRRLRDQKAQQLGLTVGEEDIDQLMQQVERKNNIPSGLLPQVLAKEGIPLERYKQGLRDQLLQSRLMARVIRPMITVTDEELRNLFNQGSEDSSKEEEVHLGHILLEVPNGAGASELDQVQEKALELSEALRKGASLASLAGQYSSDPSGLTGGDIGWFKKGELLPLMEGTLFQLPEGSVSNPIRSPQGIHIFKVLEKRFQIVEQGDQLQMARYKARHILIKVDEQTDEATGLARIRTLLDQIRQGESFAQLAMKHSQDPGSAAEGGDLGWFKQGVMVPPFDQALKALSEGKVSDPVRTAFGWHLIFLEEKEVVNSTAFDAQKPVLQQRITEAKTQSRYKQWLRDLRLRAFVEYR